MNQIAEALNPNGGKVICGTTSGGAQTQICTYEGVQLGGGASLVGPGVQPSAVPSLALAIGAGVELGAHSYGYTWVTAAGETPPSPLATVTTGLLAAPSSAPTLALVAGAGLSTGVYQYAYTDVTAAGETLPSPLGSITTGVTPAPSTDPAPYLIDGLGIDAGLQNYQVTFVTASGETTPSPISNTVQTGSPSAAPANALGWNTVFGGGNLSAGVYNWATTWTMAGGGETTPSPLFTKTMGAASSIILTPLNLPPPAWAVNLNLYRTVAGGAQLKFVLTAGASSTSLFDNVADGSLGANAPTVSTALISQVVLMDILTGDGTVTSRKIYRRFNGAGTFKLVATIADNATTTYTDSTPNASLGAAAPSSNTAMQGQVAISGVATGPTGTTSRKLYRTAAGGSQLKLQSTIADNTTTTGTDTTADSALGANAPTGDTSGLTTVPGQVNAGSTSLLTAGAGPFPPSPGGWVKLVGDQFVRYHDISGNTLTGIPASGPGSITATVPYGTVVTAVPALVGVSTVR